MKDFFGVGEGGGGMTPLQKIPFQFFYLNTFLNAVHHWKGEEICYMKMKRN